MPNTTNAVAAKERFVTRVFKGRAAAMGVAFLGSVVLSSPVQALDIRLSLGDTIYQQAVAEGAYGHEAIAAFYRDRGYQPIFTGESLHDAERRAALIEALQTVRAHGLPVARYDVAELVAAFRAAGSRRSMGKAEALAARMFLDFADDLTAGAVEPRRIDSGIVRAVPKRDPMELLSGFATAADPRDFLRGLTPKTAEYARLMAEKHRLEYRMAHGGWGRSVPAGKLSPGESGDNVVALRNRLIAKGYLQRSSTATYDNAMQRAVMRFQRDHGLEPDGVAGASTIEAVNATVDERLASVLVAMERERWLNAPRGKRHVLVNLTDFGAKILDDDKVTFETRAVIGERDPAKRTPEFSDEMEYMEINPDWTVPRGILARDYLPRLQRNRGALGHLKVVDSRGRVVPRSRINFSRYTARNFPFHLRQPPGPRNALGTVKYMFPNKHAIYLHDTPDKSLFSRERRAYSNGCIRLNDPHAFGYALLAVQMDNPKEHFDRILNSRQQTRVHLDEHVPVHLIYRTAFTRAKGKVNYRYDIYGRDAKIWAALRKAGVELGVPQG